MPLSVSLRQLEYAVAIGRRGGFAAAAAALNVSQPSLSVAVAALEAELGRPIFLRRRGGPVRPTAFGRAFLAEAERNLAGIARLLGGEAAPVAFAVPEDLAPALVGPVLARARALDPAARLAARLEGFDAIAAGLAEGRLDFALTYDLGLAAGFEKRVIGRLVPHVLAAADHPLARRGARPRLAEIAAEPLVLTDQSLSVGHVAGLFRARGLDLRIAHLAPSFETMRSLVAHGFGLGLSHTRSRAGASHDGAPLVALDLADPPPPEPVVIASNPANPLSAFAARLVAALDDLPL